MIDRLYDCLKCGDRDLGLIKAVNSEYEVEQTVGGTRGTSYIYVYDGNFFVNIRYLRSCRVVVREKMGRGRTYEVYRIPKEMLEGKPLLLATFANSGFGIMYVCIAEKNVIKCCDCPLLKENDELAMQVASKFKSLQSEDVLTRLYLDVVPRLAKEILNIARKSGAGSLLFAGRAERTLESIYKPGFSLLMSMILSTAQGRIQSLLVKISHVLELAVAAKIIDSLEGISAHEYWWVEFTWNRPLAIIKSRITNKEYTLFYQPSILPHILPGFEPSAPKHLVPDIVVFEGRLEEVGWGRLHKLIESGVKPVLAIEVKTGIQIIKWEQTNYIINQLKEYTKLLKPKSIALVSLRDIDPLLKSWLKSFGIKFFENITSEDVQREFKDYILKTLAI